MTLSIVPNEQSVIEQGRTNSRPAGSTGTSQARLRFFSMHERKQIAEAARAQQEIDAPAAWKDYRDAQARRLENLVRLRAERMRQLAEQNEKPDA